MLIAMTGLPGTGKSLLAGALGIALGGCVVSVDSVEAGIRRAGVSRLEPVQLAAYAAAQAVAEDQLRLGQVVIADAVNAAPAARRVWELLARTYDAQLWVVETVCSDLELHRRRIEQREAGPAAAPVVDWSKVEQVRRTMRPWTAGRRLTVDSAFEFEPAARDTARRLLRARDEGV